MEGYVGVALAAGLLAFFGFQASLQIRLNLFGRTVPATLLEGHSGGRASFCTYKFMAESEPRTLKGSCYFVPSLAVDYLPKDPGLARSHGQPNLELDVGGVVLSLALMVVSVRHLSQQRRGNAGR